MSDKRFDDILRDKLQSANITNSKGDWAAFSAKYKNVISQDESFDKVLKREVSNHTVPYNPSSWIVLRDRLRRVKHIREYLHQAKGLELIFASLLCISFYFNSGVFMLDNSVEVNTQQAMTLIEDENTIVASSTAITNQNKEASAVDPKTEINSIQEKSNSKFTKASFKAEDLVSQSNKNVIKTPIDQKSIDVKTSNSSFTSSDQGINQNGIDIIGNNPVTENSFLALNDDNESKATHKDYIENNISLLTIDNISRLNTNMLSINRDVNLNANVAMFEKDRQIKPASSLAFYISTGLSNNFISTPYDNVLGLDAYTHKHIGKQVSVGLSKQWGKAEIMLGLSFANLEYSPIGVTDEFVNDEGVYEVSLNKISFNSLSVPLNWRQHEQIGQGWSVFTNIGLEGSVLANANYTIVEDLIIPDNNPSPTPFPNPVENTSLIYDKEFTKGVFEDGATDNSFKLYSNFGFGIQKAFKNGSSLFVLPSYQLELTNTQIGPNRDMYDRLMFDVGFKINLK